MSKSNSKLQKETKIRLLFYFFKQNDLLTLQADA